MIKKYHSYLIGTFFYKFLITTIIFFSVSFILIFFEELKFFNKYDAEVYKSIFATFLNTPSVLFELFPFIFLISTKFFFMSLSDKNEIELLNKNGIDNFKFLTIISLTTLFMGLLIIILFYTLSSNLKNHYLNIKNSYTEDKYLAIVNENGLWIKENTEDNSFVVNAKKFKINSIEGITITQTILDTGDIINIISEKGDISAKLWKLSNVKIINEQGKIDQLEMFSYKSNFNGEIISNLFSNLNSLNIYQLLKLSENYKKIGYSSTEVDIHLNKLYSLPFFFFLMTILGGLVMILLKIIKSKFLILILGIFMSVIVFYINYFSSLFGANETIPVGLSIWLPNIILFLICSIGLIRINEI